MSKSTNLITRLDPDLKATAEIACAYLGTTLSSVVRGALRNEIDRYYKKYQFDRRHWDDLMESRHYQHVIDILNIRSKTIAKSDSTGD